MNVQNMNAFREWYDAGYRELIPIVPPGASLSPRSHYSTQALGKQPGIPWDNGLWGALKGWPTVQVDDDKIDEWGGYGASVGLRRGQVITIDIDAMDPAQADALEALAIEMLGPAPVRVGQAPKRALLYRTAGAVQFRKVRFKGESGLVEQVEVPPQLVIDGIHAKTGRPYGWPRGRLPFDKLSLVTQETLDAFRERLRELLPPVDGSDAAASVDRASVDQARLQGDADRLERALATLPNKHEVFGYDEWVKIAAALRGALPHDQERGCQIFEDFSARTDLLDPEEDAARIYRGLTPPFALGADYLLDLASKHSAESAAVRAEIWLDPPGSDEPLFPENLPNAFGKEGPTRKPLVFQGLREAADGALADGSAPLIDGLLDQGAMTVLYGESNSGKTFCAMDMAHAIASGRAWGGMEVARARVVYVAAEGGRGAKKRAAALRARYGVSADDWMIMLLQPVDLLHADADLRPLIEAVRAALGDWKGPVLIVLDTLSRAMAGGDENASTDMGVMVKHLDAVRNATGAHVLVVHHSGKDKARGARGHSLLRAATDTEIEIADRTIAVTKQRDLDGEWSAAFELAVVQIGFDAKGRPVTSCTVNLIGKSEREAQQVAAVQEAASGKEHDMLAALEALEGLSSDGKPGAKVSELVGYFLDKQDKMSSEAIRSTLRRLAAKGAVERTDRQKWVKKRSESLRPFHLQLISESGERSKAVGLPVYDNSNCFQ